LTRPAGRFALPLAQVLTLAGLLFLPVGGPCSAQGEANQGQATSAANQQKKKKEEPPKGTAVGQRKAGAAERAVKSTGASEAPLKFGDDDLLKFHRGAAQAGADAGDITAEPESEGSEGENAPEKGPGGAAPPERKPPARPKGANSGTSAGQDAPPDPLKVFKDREEAEKFRTERIKRSRDKIAQIQSKLEHLRQKRGAILDPFQIMPKPLSEDEKASDAGLGSKELLATVDQEIRSGEADLAVAQQELVEVELRFAGPSER
jgi:hypothetical protein